MESAFFEGYITVWLKKCMYREILLLEKYKDYLKMVKKTELEDVIKEFEQTADQHLQILNENSVKFNAQG